MTRYPHQQYHDLFLQYCRLHHRCHRPIDDACALARWNRLRQRSMVVWRQHQHCYYCYCYLHSHQHHL